ncbi:MAG: ABC transporter permease [Clostridia bacterium]
MKRLNNLISLALILVLGLIFSIKGQYFLTLSNLMAVTTTMAEFGIMAYGMMLAIMVSGINLTLGSVCGLTSLLVITLFKAGLPIELCVGISLAAALLMGLATGWFIVKLQVAPMLLTLAMSMMFTGISYVISQGNAVSGFPKAYWFLGQGSILGVPAQTWLLVLVTVILTILLRCSPWGTKLYAVGNSPTATQYSGVNVDQVTISAYVVGALLAGISGVIMSSRVATARLDLGNSYQTKCIAAVILGGASMSGGSGTTLGTLLGVTIIAMLSNGLNHIGVSSHIQQFILGILLIVMLIFNANVLTPLHKWTQRNKATELTN